MNKKINFILIALLIQLNVFANDEIFWESTYSPPSLISQGDMKNQGYSDLARELFIINLNSFTHNIVHNSYSQAVVNVQTGKNYCFVGLKKDVKNQENIEFSEPFLNIFSNMLYIRDDDKKYFQKYLEKENALNLHRLFQNSNHSFGYIKNRIYSTFINDLILKNINKKHFVFKESNDSDVLIRMLSRNKIDYILEYPHIFDYIKNEQELDKEYSFYPILDSNVFEKIYVGCSKSDFGKKVIFEINQIISKNEDVFESFYRTWLSSDSKKMYDKMNNSLNR